MDSAKGAGGSDTDGRCILSFIKKGSSPGHNGSHRPLLKLQQSTLPIYKIVLDSVHGGARPPPVCAHRAWVDFFKMALKKSAKAYGFRHIGF